MMIFGLEPFSKVNVSLLPPNFVPYIMNPLDTMETLTECPQGLQALQAWLNAAGQPYDTDTMYIAYKFGVDPSAENYSSLTNNLTLLYQQSAMGVKGIIPFEFNVTQASEIQSPSWLSMGLQDDVVFGQTREFYDHLSSAVKNQSQLVVYGGYSGSA